MAAAQADLAAEQTNPAQRRAAWQTCQAAAGGRPKRRTPDFGAPVRKAEQRLAAAEQAAMQLAAQAREGQANLTDPDSRVMKSIHGRV